MMSKGFSMASPWPWGSAGIALCVVLTLANCVNRTPAGAAGEPAKAASPGVPQSAGTYTALSTELGSAAATAGGGAEKSTHAQGGQSMPLRDSYYKCARNTEGNTQAIQDCIATEFTYQDARLNTIYQGLVGILSGVEKIALKRDQEQWLVKRDRECAWDENSEGQGQRMDANDCLLKITAARADELEGMSR